MTGYVSESENDNTSYGEASDRSVSVAWIRGRLRLARTPSAEGREDTGGASEPTSTEEVRATVDAKLYSPMNWRGLAEWLDEHDLVAPDVAAAIVDTHGLVGIESVLHYLQNPGAFCIAVAEMVAFGEAPVEIGRTEVWSGRAVGHAMRTGMAYRLLSLGVDVNVLAPFSVEEVRSQLLELTRTIQEQRGQQDDEIVGRWLDLCSIAARRDPISLDFAGGLVTGEGWDRCWLRFVIALVRAEASSGDQSRLTLVALDHLSEDLRPFVGDPRSVDLYFIHDTIADTIRRAVRLLDAVDWIDGIRKLMNVSDGISTTL